MSHQLWSALTCHHTPKTNTKPVANPWQASRPAFENSCCAWLLTHLALRAAKALPIASWTPDATGAIAAAVIASVVHDLITRGTIERRGTYVKPRLSRRGPRLRQMKSGETRKRIAAILWKRTA